MTQPRHLSSTASTTGRSLIYAVLTACCAFVGSLSTGCTWFSEKPDFAARLEKEAQVDTPPAEVTDEKKVRWDGGGVIIGETDALAYTPDSYVQEISSLAAQRKLATIQGMVQAYPDIALQTLQESDTNAANRQALQLIASMLDTTWSNGDVWQTYVKDVTELPKRSDEQLDVRTRFWRYLKNHQPQQARKLRITKTLKREHGVVLRAEFHRLESIAAMMDEKHDDSISSLETAIQLVEEPCPWYACKLRLLLGEFYRHAKRWDDWKSTWQKAVIDNSQLASSHLSLDPQFWNRAAFLRPAGMEWPDEVIGNLKSVLMKLDVAETENSMRLTSDEAVIWFAIGMQHLRRAEGQNALLAFKKSEASESNQHTAKALQLYQARSLVATGQPGAASAILFRMVSTNEGTALADRAKAILGSMKLQNGSVIQGLNLVQSAIQSIESWPRDEQSRARADFGLALLMRGQETEGLRQLEIARTEFESAGELEQARQCLWNRAQYFEKTDQKDEFRTASQELNEMESRLY